MLFLIALGLVSAALLWIQPNQYYSFSSAVPTNAALTDKGYLFNDKIDGLYSALGNYSDLERLFATSTLDTAYKYLIYKYKLADHYDISGANENIRVQKTILAMSDDQVRIEKTENGLFRIHVTDTDPELASTMANDLMTFVNDLNTDLQLQYNKQAIKELGNRIQSRSKEYQQRLDSSSGSTVERSLIDLQLKNNMDDIQTLQRIKSQFETAIQFQQPALRVVENASPSYKHIKPKRVIGWFSSMILGFLAMLCCVVILETVSHYKQPS
jgi:hypothetical protein